MARIEFLVLSLACICVQGFLNQPAATTSPVTTRNTIFADEKFEGEIFEDLDVFEQLDITARNSELYRLPNTTKPSHYTVLWTLDFSRAIPTQSGTVSILLNATQANVNEIVIHAHNLTITNVRLQLGTTEVPVTYTLEPEYHFMRIRLNEGSLNYNPTTPQYYTLTIDFGANLRDDMYGIYRTWFRNNPTDTAVSWMASTQFQATAARFAFPCYDEPSFKATFDVTIRRPVAYQSWFCTVLLRTDTPAAAPLYRDDVYHTTPVMSTYLLALIVAEYGSITVNNVNGQLAYEVIARPGAIDAGQGQYALEVGQDLLNQMSLHTNYDFYSQHSRLKMTQASIPDFGAGAMENWGLLTYREAYLMYDEDNTNSHFKQIIAYILSHEIAHMWFGNLVTCEWWDVLWLNEGFARYYQYYLTYWVEDMGFGTRFITEQVHTALLSDSANNPQPLTNPGVGSPSSVSAMFSTISYNKGAAVIRMTEHLLGFTVAEQGLRNYLRGKEFQTAEPIDLFEYQEAAGIAAGALNYNDFSFIEYYKSWTEQPGHPVLNVHVNHQTGDMTIYQRRFNINTGYSNINTNYIVPITFATASNPDFVNTKPTHIISKAITVINRGSVGDQWVIFNKQQTGYYRVNYDDYTWDLIAIALRGADRTVIHEYNRAQIVNDVFQFARSGLMSYSRALNILSFLQYETDYAPWLAALTGFSWLRNRLASESTVTQLNQVNERLELWSRAVITSLTYRPITGEHFLRAHLRSQLAPVLCNIGVAGCLEEARNQLNDLRVSNIAVPVDNRNWVYCSGLRQGGVDEFNYLWNRFLTHNVYTEKILLLQNLGCTANAASLNTFLTNIVSENFVVRPQDYTTALNSAVSGNEGNTNIVFTYIRTYPDLVASAFGDSLSTPLLYVASRLRSNQRIDEFISWAESNQESLGNAYTTAINEANSARNSIIWAESVQADITNYIETNGDPITTSTEAPVSPTTVSTTQQVPIVEPVTPSLPEPPSSASTAFISVVVMVLAVIGNIVF
uniref:Aminopeptidase N 1 n=1 Tax=Lymantria dispar TaxID=13123 RepID=Q9XYV2_LYMDI|nr:aminopeptidase N 1 [Lymantria dispar]